MWEIEHDSYDDRGKSFPLTLPDNLDPKNPEHMNINKSSGKFRLRHFSTGKLLSAIAVSKDREGSKSKSGQDEQLVIHLANIDPGVDALEDYCRFKVEPILKNFDFIEERKTYYLSSEGNYMKNSDKEMKRAFILERYAQVTDSNEDLFTPLEDKDFNEYRCDVCMTPEFSSEDAFIFEKLDQEEISDLLYVRSALPLIK